MLLLLLIACHPCVDTADLPMIDPDDRLDAEQEDVIQAAYDDFIAWTGAEGLCVQRVRPGSVEEGGEARYGPSLAVDPDAESMRNAVFLGMCEVLDDAEGHSQARPDLFEVEGEPSFAWLCARGPTDVRWKDPIRRACGTDGLNEWDRYLADEVYPHAPSGRNDGHLELEVGTRDPLDADYFVQFGDRLLRDERDSDGIVSIFALDPATGTEQPLWSSSGPSAVLLSGGRDGAALMVDDFDDVRLVSLALDGSSQDVRPPAGVYAGYGRVGNGALWRSSDRPTRLDLATGFVTVFDPPVSAEGLDALAGTPVPLDDGVYVEVMSAEVEVSGDLVSIGVHGHDTWRLRPEVPEWTHLTSGLHLLPAGVDSHGRVVGTMFSQAGYVLAAYDPETDQLLVSDEACVEGNYPWVMSGDTVWNPRPDGALQPVELR